MEHDMGKSYKHTPTNWHQLTKVIIYNKERCVSKILTAPKCLLLDTCTIMQYENLQHDSQFFTYVHDCFDAILITRTILMELESEDGAIEESHISFLEKLSEETEAYIFDEEWCCDYLKHVFNKSDKELNGLLAEAIKFIKKIFNNCVDAFFDDAAQVNVYFKALPTTEVFGRFFTDIRQKKESGDSLGEELITLIILLMANVQEINACKFVLFSNDKQSYAAFLSVKSYIKKKCGWDAFMCQTTCNIAQTLYRLNYIEKEEIRNILEVSYHNNPVKCYAAGQHDLRCEEYIFSADTFMDMLEGDSMFRVLY